MIEVRYAQKEVFDEIVATNADVHVEVLADYDPMDDEGPQACVMVAINTSEDRKLLFIYADGAVHFDVEEG